MIVIMLIILGLCLGSFTNALVWRLYQQDLPKNRRAKKVNLSIVNGRSVCVHCGHVLSAADLVPVFSWLWLRGKCRYCKKPIDDKPWPELGLPALFVLSYLAWPRLLLGWEWLGFGVWLAVLTGLAALFIHDLRWMLLPNRIVVPLIALQAAYDAVVIIRADDPWRAIWQLVLCLAITSGVFYVLFQISDGKWIGGGDIKLGFLLGLIVMKPSLGLLVVFLASCIGTLVTLPLLLRKKLQTSSRVPFGPLLISGCVITVLFGQRVIDWYGSAILGL